MDRGADELRPRPMPEPRTKLFGRDDEVEELVRLLADARLVTLVGAPGCGKTRLGGEVAQRLAPQFDAGAQTVELAPWGPDADVPAAVAAALGIAERPRQSSLETLCATLAESELLLVLDNCEHLVGGVAETLERLLQTCPGLRMLTTSRTALRLVGERVWPVRPLGEPAAVELFTDRAQLANGGFRLEVAGRGAVELICHRLDRLPLAIELTAAWTRVLSPRQILERLDDALPLMSDGAHSAAARHETMAATVDWSLRFLTDDVRELFERLSVFAGGFDLAAVEAVTDAAGDALRGLTVLVDHSLVLTETVSDESMRYRLLEPIRQCGAERLAASGRGDVVRQRHAEHFLAVAQGLEAHLPVIGATVWRLDSNRSHSALRQMKCELSNFRCAFDWARRNDAGLGLRLALATSQYLQHAGLANQGRAWLAEMLSGDGQDPGLRAAGLGCLGRLAWREGDYEAARGHIEESVGLLQGPGDELVRAERLRDLGLVALSDDDVSGGEWLCDQALATFRQHDDKVGLGWALIYRGWIHYAQGQLDPSSDCMWEAVAIGEASTAHLLRVYGYLGLAFAADVQGDVAAQRRYFVEASAACRLFACDFDSHVPDPEALWACFRLAHTEGRGRTALRLAGGALELSRSTGSVAPAPWVADLEPRIEALRAEFGPALADRLIERGAQMDPIDLIDEALELPKDQDSPLSVREAEVAELVGQGLSNVEIGERLFISRRTVETHLEHIRRKLGLVTRHDLLLWAMRRRQPPTAR